ncbi:MotA/TolQ/ExbB proton channel family protein [Flammeovirga sp. MY04]|uniref:MotA/TolQ/ExbB proton channel family protein n=1 Tax=Flammeovirga sp. MY04 TaxID=1191459 RepID=UPI000806259C|nr:MotA/TolQ/ExbB proton channel family protein [Flammeovirga sp. MY04]ANQ50389.1 MotA/TolQ/ExbB proton channel family protein [Flammeovirga sp. MY04]
MSIVEFYVWGGFEFMNTLSLVGIIMIVFMVFRIMKINNKVFNPEKSLMLMKETGTLALVIGILGQLIGLFSAMIAIEAAGGVPLALLAGGIKVSMITTIYGFIIFLISRIAGIIINATAKPE